MSHLVDFVKYAQCRVILDALTRAGNHQAHAVYNAKDADRDAERAKYYEMLGVVHQAQQACERALLVIARSVVASDTPVNDVVNMMYGAGFDWAEDAPVVTDIVTELTAIAQEAR